MQEVGQDHLRGNIGSEISLEETRSQGILRLAMLDCGDVVIAAADTCQVSVYFHAPSTSATFRLIAKPESDKTWLMH